MSHALTQRMSLVAQTLETLTRSKSSHQIVKTLRKGQINLVNTFQVTQRVTVLKRILTNQAADQSLMRNLISQVKESLRHSVVVDAGGLMTKIQVALRMSQ